ncbi:MAG: Hsp20/alpha crystallin family protein [Candidatus Hodarchaeota archaeon]
MDENVNNKYEDEEKETKLEIEIEKKQQEIGLKRKQTFFLNQSKDTTIDNSIWGKFKIRPAESIEIVEDEKIYRTPLANIVENDDAYIFFIELPGLDKKYVNITLQEGILEILGEKALKYKEDKDEKKEKKEKEEKKDKHKEKKEKESKKKEKEIKGDYLRREFISASFYRSFHLPEEINSEGIDASFKNGVLKLIIPKKTAETKDKKVIEIK